MHGVIKGPRGGHHSTLGVRLSGNRGNWGQAQQFLDTGDERIGPTTVSGFRRNRWSDGVRWFGSNEQ